jgi:hypothetical protein
MVRTVNDWVDLAATALDLGRLTGVEVRVSLSPVRDVMCCKVAGTTVEVTRKELEERNFVKLYAALQAAATSSPYENPTATEVSMLQQQYAMTRQAIADNQYKNVFGAPWPETPEPEPEPKPVTWREPRETPELELGEPSEIAKMDVLMQEPFAPTSPTAPDLILDGRDTLDEQEPNRACSEQRAATREK